MVSVHTERLLKGLLWTLRAQTMTRASQGAWWECDGSVVGGKTKPPLLPKKTGRRFFIMVKSVKYFDMSHTPWCSSSWAFCLSAGEQLTFFTIKLFASPPPGKTFHEEPWLAIAAVLLGFFPWTPGIKTLWGSHFSCVASQVSLFSPLSSKTWLIRNFVLCWAGVGLSLIVFLFIFFGLCQCDDTLTKTSISLFQRLAHLFCELKTWMQLLHFYKCSISKSLIEPWDLIFLNQE